MRSIYLTDYCNSGQKTEEEYNRTAYMMAHSSKQQGQYRKIIKVDNLPISVPSTIPSSTIPSSLSSSTWSSSSSPSFTSTSSTPVIRMPDDKFKEYMSKVLVICILICIQICMDNYIIILSLRSWLHYQKTNLLKNKI